MKTLNSRSFLRRAVPLIVAAFGLGAPCVPAAGQCGPSITGRFGGETTGLTRFDANLLLVANGMQVELVSVANPSAPAPLSPRLTAPLEAPATKLVMKQGGTHAYALLKNGNVQIFNVGYFPTPYLQPFTTIPTGDAVDIALYSEFLYIITQTEEHFGFDPYIDSELLVYEVLASSFVLRQTFEPLTSDYGYDRLSITGNRLWAGFHEFESSIFGVEGFVLASPGPGWLTRGAAALNNVPLEQDARITAMTNGSGLLMVGFQRDGSESLTAVDVSNPAFPEWRPPLAMGGGITCMANNSNVNRTAVGGQGVYTYNYLNPYAPVLLGFYSNDLARVSQMLFTGSGTDYWAGGPAGLMTMNTTSNSSVTPRITTPALPTAPHVVRQRGNTTVVLDYTLNQLLLFDYTLPEGQQHRGTIQLPYYSELVEIGEASGGFTLACVASKGNPEGDVIAIYDITNPAAWVHRSTITGFTAHLMSVSSSRMYVMTTGSEFKIIELAFPTSPGMRSTTYYGGAYTNYTALASWSNNAAALGTATAGLRLINTTDATAPVVAAIWNPVSGYGVRALAKGAGVLYVSSSTGPNPQLDSSVRLESLVVTTIGTPLLRFRSDASNTPGMPGIFDALTYFSTPAGAFLIGGRDYRSNSATLYALSNAFAVENVLTPIGTVSLYQAHGNVAPGGAGAPGGGTGAARFYAVADSAGLYQVAMPTQWAPGFSGQTLGEQRVCHGGSIGFLSLVNGNPTAITYQWRRDGVALSNGTTAWGSTITGATGQELTIIDARPGDRGTYTLYATNTCGTTNTYPVFLNVLSADMGVQGGQPGSDNLLDNNDFVVFINFFFTHDYRADIGMQGGVTGYDYMFDNNDFVVFINLFFGTCP